MTSIRKATLKTAVVFISAFVLLVILVEFFNLQKIVSELFLFDPVYYMNPNWRYLSSAVVVAFGSVTGIFGYVMAKRKKRNAPNWAGLCFVFNIWGLIFLSFLPSLEEEGDCQTKGTAGKK
jgi:cytochrome bd-type quinol oxidase subunit 2